MKNCIPFFKKYKYPVSITLTLIALIFVFQNATCGNNSVSSLGTSSTGSSSTSTTTVTSGTLTLSATAAVVAVGNTIQFTASGGSGTYDYYVTGDCGSISQSGLFIATVANTCTVSVSDTSSPPYTVSQNILVTSTGTTGTTAIVVSPENPVILPGSSITLVASGGTPPYTFTSNNTSYGTFTSQPTTSSAVFTALSNTLTSDVSVNITVTDSSSPEQTQSAYSVTVAVPGSAVTSGSTFTSPPTATLPASQNSIIVDQYFGIAYSNQSGASYPTLTLFGTSPTYLAGWNCNPLTMGPPCMVNISLSNFYDTSPVVPFSYRGIISITGRGGSSNLEYCIDPSDITKAYVEYVNGGVSALSFNALQFLATGNGLTLFNGASSSTALLNIDGKSGAGSYSTNVTGEYSSNANCSDFPTKTNIIKVQPW